jgi:acyl-CoA thioesterase-2
MAHLLALLDLEAAEGDSFYGQSPPGRGQRIFGGQVLAQALVAASRTVQGLGCHSLHAYFLRAGDPEERLLYRVERTRDGASFTARRVTALQHERPIFVMACSFHIAETGFEHQSAKPDVPDPDMLEDARTLAQRDIESLPPDLREWALRPRPLDFRPVTPRAYVERGSHAPVNNLWLRANRPLPADANLHRAILAYASDMTLIDTALLPHDTNIFSRAIQVASLDHAMWFHRPFRADEWLLYAQDSPTAFGARGFSRGQIFSRDGQLIASVAQEGLMRPRPKAK